ncbi:MAG: hypothetical protein KUG77_06095, partial [Nannocystaceae bacterium]|nr:hypothetical protein [Nannocystaceae bacterium]
STSRRQRQMCIRDRHYPDVLALDPRRRAIAEVAVGAAALLACVATSSPETSGDTGLTAASAGEPDFEPEPQFAAVVLHNARSADSVVRLRRLASAVDVDCASILGDPGALLAESLLGPSESWTLPAGDNLGLESTPGRLCEVIRVEADGAAPRWLVWTSGALSTSYLPDEEPAGEGVVRLVPEGVGLRFEGSPTFVFSPDDPARGVEQCAPVGDGQRLDWGDPLPIDGVLLGASWGPDGCGAIVLSDDGETPSPPWFLCIPETSWPFLAGDALTVRPVFGTGLDAVEVTTQDLEGSVTSRMRAYRASDVPSLEGLSLRYESDVGCGFDVETSCGTVARVGEVVLETTQGAQIGLAAGESVSGLMLAETNLETSVTVLAAQERVALNPECALGPDVLGPDLAIVMTQTAAEGE